MIRREFAILLGTLFVTAGIVAAHAAPQKPAKTLRVGILVYEGVYDTEFIAPLDVFSHAASRSGGKVQVFTISPDARLVKTAEGLHVQADYTFANAPRMDWLIVPSGANYRKDMEDRRLVGWIRDTGDKSKLVHSNCWGAFLLGAAGLLDGKRATTFPSSLDEFAKAFPKVRCAGTCIWWTMAERSPQPGATSATTPRSTWWKSTWGQTWRTPSRRAW